MAGIMLPVMVMSLAMGIEVTYWSVTKLEMQRIADVSAWAGAMRYAATTNPQAATNAAADLAEINGVSGASSRSWNPTTLTTTDNFIAAQVIGGVRNVNDKAVAVTVKRNVATSFSRIFPGVAPSVTVSATATAEIVQTVAGPQPCLFAIRGDGDGVTTGTDITLNGSASITAGNCSVRSDAGIILNGASSISASGTYAGGSITTNGSSRITGGSHANAGQISDPYVTYAPLQKAFSSLSSGGTQVNLGGVANQTISPSFDPNNPNAPIKAYSSITVGASAKLKLNPGLYIVNGNIAFNGAAQITGTGVTIISSGTLTYGGSASVSLSAPDQYAIAGGVPGMLFASQSSSASSFNGAASFPFSGVIYYPNGNLSFNGAANPGNTGCTQVIAGTITLNGASNLSANCQSYGTLNFGSLPSTSNVTLVR